MIALTNYMKLPYINHGVNELADGGTIVQLPLRGVLVEDEVELGILVNARPVVVDAEAQE